MLAAEPPLVFMGLSVPQETYRGLSRELRKAIRSASARRSVHTEFRSRLWNQAEGPFPQLEVLVDPHGLPEVVGKGPDVTYCVMFQTRWPHCQLHAGSGTLHPGTGPCRRHGGTSRRERMVGAMVTSHAIARVLDVDPWEAIEISMRRAAAWSGWYQSMLATVQDDDELRPGGAAHDWVKGAERTTELMAKYAKMAHDMNISERHVQAVELQGQLIAQVLSTTIHELGLGDEVEDRARGIMETVLRSLAERGQAHVVMGELTS